MGCALINIFSMFGSVVIPLDYHWRLDKCRPYSIHPDARLCCIPALPLRVSPATPCFALT